MTTSARIIYLRHLFFFGDCKTKTSWGIILSQQYNGHPYFVINPGSCKRNEHTFLIFYFHLVLSDQKWHGMAIWAGHLQPEPLARRHWWPPIWPFLVWLKFYTKYKSCILRTISCSVRYVVVQGHKHKNLTSRLVQHKKYSMYSSKDILNLWDFMLK